MARKNQQQSLLYVMNIDCGRANLAPVTVYIRHTISVKTMVTLCLPLILSMLKNGSRRQYTQFSPNALSLFFFEKYSTYVDPYVHAVYSLLSKHARNLTPMKIFEKLGRYILEIDEVITNILLSTVTLPTAEK